MLPKVIITITVTMPAVLAAPTSDPIGKSSAMVIPLTKYSSSLDTKKGVNTDVLKSHIPSRSPKNIRSMEKRRIGPPYPSVVKRDTSGSGVDLVYHDSEDVMVWYGTISIGTPAKSFTGKFFLLFDSGSSDLFVPVSTGNENCRSHYNLWDPASSSTAKDLNGDFWLRFTDGRTVSGNQYTDNVTIAGFTADIQTIGAATEYSDWMAESKFVPDGILGLGFPSMSLFHDQRPLFYTLFNEGKLPQPVFSLKLTDSGGELYVGGMNEALYIGSSLAFIPVTSQSFWELMIDSIKVNDGTFITNIPVVIDTGAHLFWGDSLRLWALLKADGGKILQGPDAIHYTFPCDSFPSVTFTIGGKPFLIPAHVLNLGEVESGSSDCFSAFATREDDSEDTWQIGSIFLQLYYTVFDFGSEFGPRIGFATLAG